LEQSLETLTNSDYFDFYINKLSVYKKGSKLLDDKFTIERIKIINEKTYRSHYKNKCLKIKHLILDPYFTNVRI
jgi:hypothetical protein